MMLPNRRATSALLVALAAVTTLRGAAPQPRQEISRNGESIHQEVVFAAGRDRVYRALTDPQEFTKVVELGPLKNVAPAEIGPKPGDTFSLFGGHIVGRNIEMVPSQRLVQAWRTTDWPAGVYSVVRFDLRSQGAQTLLVFDHTGFPASESASLLDGWNSHYWEPLKKFLALGAAPQARRTIGATAPIALLFTLRRLVDEHRVDRQDLS